MSIDFSWHSRGYFLAALRALLVSCLFLPTAGVTDQDTSGGETLESVVERRASGSGEMILLTRDAFLKAKEVGTKVFFENQSTETVIGGWTVVHLLDEDTTELIARYSKNIAVWSGAHIDRRLSSESRRLEAWGGELAALGRMFENTCGQVPVPSKSFWTLLVAAWKTISLRGDGRYAGLIQFIYETEHCYETGRLSMKKLSSGYVFSHPIGIPFFRTHSH